MLSLNTAYIFAQSFEQFGQLDSNYTPISSLENQTSNKQQFFRDKNALLYKFLRQAILLFFVSIRTYTVSSIS